MGAWKGVFIFVAVLIILFIGYSILAGQDGSNGGSGLTGNVVTDIARDVGVVKSQEDRCAERFFDCIQGCPSSSLNKNSVSHRCLGSCGDSIAETCSGSSGDLSSENVRKTSCLTGCTTFTGTLTRSCVDNCLD